MKTLAVLVILVLMALYINAEDFKRRRPKPQPGVISRDEDGDEDMSCDPATQYGYGRPAERCACPEVGQQACLQCNLCTCRGSRGLWMCPRMACPWGDDSKPWVIEEYTRGNKLRKRCVQPSD